MTGQSSPAGTRGSRGDHRHDRRYHAIRSRHLDSHWCKERAATEALGYILSESEAARSGVAQLVNSGGAAIDGITQVKTEVRGEDGERVDLVGFGDNGSERLLVELKFWAALTVSQPNAYLKRLPREEAAALLFIVPESRVNFLWEEVRKLAAKEYPLVPTQEAGRLRSAALDGGGRRLMMTSWPALFDSMASAARGADDGKAESEIAQLRGLTERMDMGAFLPLDTDDLRAKTPRRILALMRLVGRRRGTPRGHWTREISEKVPALRRRPWMASVPQWPLCVVWHFLDAMGSARPLSIMVVAREAGDPQFVERLS